jgi:hypothetical protein
MRHIDRCALITHINNLDAFCIQPHPDGHDVAAAQAKDALDALTFKVTGNQCCDGLFMDYGRGHGTYSWLSSGSRGAKPVRIHRDFKEAALFQTSESHY